MEQARARVGAGRPAAELARSAARKRATWASYEVVFGTLARTPPARLRRRAAAPDSTWTISASAWTRSATCSRASAAVRQPARWPRARVRSALIEAGVEADTGAGDRRSGAAAHAQRRSVLDIGRPRTAPESDPDASSARHRRRNRQPLRGAARNRPHHRAGRPSRVRQDHHAGETGGRRTASRRDGRCA